MIQRSPTGTGKKKRWRALFNSITLSHSFALFFSSAFDDFQTLCLFCWEEVNFISTMYYFYCIENIRSGETEAHWALTQTRGSPVTCCLRAVSLISVPSLVCEDFWEELEHHKPNSKYINTQILNKQKNHFIHALLLDSIGLLNLEPHFDTQLSSLVN